MNSGIYRLLLLSAALNLACDPIVKAQDPGGKTSTFSLGHVAEELRSEYGPVRFHREEEFEDRFVVRGSPDSVFALVPNIYLIQEERFDRSRGANTERFSNGLPTMFVAASRDGSKVYRLAGFHEAEHSFNRLVDEGPDQRILTAREAQSRGLLCAEIVYGLSPKWWIDGASGVKVRAAEHFFAEGHEDGLLLATRWWGSAKGDRDALKIAVTRLASGFSVNLPVFWAPVEGSSVAPEVRLYRIAVGDTGKCSMGEAPRTLLH